MTDKDRDERTLAEITALRDDMRPRQAPDRVEQTLRRQFRKHHGTEQPRRNWWQVTMPIIPSRTWKSRHCTRSLSCAWRRA